MTADSLRAAAGRIVSAWEAKRADLDPVDCAIEPWGVTFARLWLEEHPADDGEAVDEAWLRAVGFGRIWPANTLLGRGNNGVVVTCCEDGMSVWNDPYGRCVHVRLIRNPTRGHVRRLAKALGIELKETHHD